MTLPVQLWLACRDTVALFLPIWLQWFRIGRSLNLFEQNDVVHLLYFGTNMLLAVMIGRHVLDCGGKAIDIGEDRASCQDFLLWLVLSQATTIIYTLYGTYHNYRLHSYFLNVRNVWLLVSTLGWIFTAYVGIPNFRATGDWTLFIFSWWMSLAIEIAFWLVVVSGRMIMLNNCICCCVKRCSSSSRKNVPVNTHVLVERLDLFVILALGEVVAGSDVVGGVKGSGSIFRVILCVLLALGLKFITFDLAEHPTSSSRKGSSRQASHALSTSAPRGCCFVWSYVPITLGVIFVAAVLEDNMHTGSIPLLQRWVLSLGLFL